MLIMLHGASVCGTAWLCALHMAMRDPLRPPAGGHCPSGHAARHWRAWQWQQQRPAASGAASNGLRSQVRLCGPPGSLAARSTCTPDPSARERDPITCPPPPISRVQARARCLQRAGLHADLLRACVYCAACLLVHLLPKRGGSCSHAAAKLIAWSVISPQTAA